MTRRERLERKLEQRQEWAEKRRAKEKATWEAHYAVPLPEGGEPIKVGHHSEKRHRKAIERSYNLAFKALDHGKMAAHHASKAAGLAEQLDSSIFSDDADAIEQLEQRIAEREAERDRIKAFNASCRKGSPDESLLDERQRANLRSIRKVCPYQLGPKGQYPAYALSNLSGNIKRDRDRLKEIKIRQSNLEAAEEAGGVVIAERNGWATVVFAEKPDREIRDALKAAGFRWSRGSWSGKADKLPECVAEMAN